MEITKEQLPQYLKLPSTFNWNWVDQELGFFKIFSIVPEDFFTELKNSTEPEKQKIARLLIKAAVHYAFILDIPRIKVQISNFGIDQANQDKVKPAPWYDIRDLGIKYLKTADKCFSEAVTLIAKDETMFARLTYADSVNQFIKTPAEFSKIYNINESPEVFLALLPLMQRVIDNIISKSILPCTQENISVNDKTKNWLTIAIAYYTLYYAAEIPSFTLLNNAVVVQYEELPWQKSMVLSEIAREKAANSFFVFAEESINTIKEFMKQNPEDFPCYTEKELPCLVITKKKSGLYL